MNHWPWDSGAISAVLGAAIGQKTIKTECGKRVPIAHANSDRETTCPDCIARIQEQREFIARMREESDKVYKRLGVN